MLSRLAADRDRPPALVDGDVDDVGLGDLDAKPRVLLALRLEVEVIVNAFLIGMMAREGWIEPIDAQQGPFILGRWFRDQVRGMGVSIDPLKATLGTVIDGALQSVVALGLDKNA